MLQAQVDEVQALQACYPDLLELAEAEAAALALAEHVAAGGAAPDCVPALGGTLQLPDPVLAGQPVLLRFTLPKEAGKPTRLQVLTNAARCDADQLQELASSTAAECARDGTPCLLLAADLLARAVEGLAAAQQQAKDGAKASRDRGSRASPQQEGRERVLSRRCLWFHHINSTTKRKHILEWGRELRLGGLSNPGIPGVVVVEGAGSDVDEYISRLRRLRWQAMAVRGEEDEAHACPQALEAARRLPLGIRELGEEEMGRLAAACREAGLEQLFLSALKLGAAGR